MLGCGEWSAYLVDRGGQNYRYEIPWQGLRVSRGINQTGQAQVNLGMSASATAASACCEILNNAEPWRDELALFRNGVLEFTGPVIDIQSNPTGGEISARDLFTWMEKRIVADDMSLTMDATEAFKHVFEYAVALEDSINLDLIARDSGLEVVVNLLGRDFRKVSDVLRQIARTAVNYVTIGRRTLVAGDLNVLTDDSSLILHDDGILTATATKEGSNLATDVAVFGATLPGNVEAAYGRAIRSKSVYGLVQESYAEIELESGEACYANALARLEAMQPIPIRLAATLSPSCDIQFKQLIPGSEVDSRVVQAAGCIAVLDIMRLQVVNVAASVVENSVNETVEIELVPLGVEQAELAGIIEEGS